MFDKQANLLAVIAVIVALMLPNIYRAEALLAPNNQEGAGGLSALAAQYGGQVVSVLGETQQNSSHLYQPSVSRDEYIDRSGRLTRRADKKLIYVVRANGAVIAANRSMWFGRGKNVDIRPGDTIVVPLDIDRMRPLTFWGNVTQILCQGAIAVAAIKTFED